MAEVPSAVARYLNIKEKRTSTYTLLERICIAGANMDRIGGVMIDDFKRVSLALPLTFAYCCAFMGILVYLTYLGSVAALESPFLSLLKDDSNICEDVPQPVTGSFEGSWDGKWITEKDWDPSKSLFVLEFLGSSVSNAEYKDIFTGFAAELAVLGKKAESRNSAFAYLMYSSYTLVYAGSNLRFYSSADATDIFFNQMLTATVSSRNGTCNSFKTTGQYVRGSYDSAEKAIVAEIPIILNNTYLGNTLNKNLLTNYRETCPQVFKVFNVEDPAIAFTKGNSAAKFSFDINSMITVLAINMGFNQVKGLTKISAQVRMKFSGGIQPIEDFDKLVAYIDPYSFSPDKIPVYCYDKSKLSGLTQAQLDGPDICFLANHDEGQIVTQLYYPVLSQMANNPAQSDAYGNLRMDACQCPAQKYNAYCNYQDVLWGLIFDSGNSTNTGKLKDIALAAQALIVADPDTGDIAFARYFEQVLGFSANVDYAKATASQTIPGAWANGKSYEGLLKDAWDVVCPWGTCAAFVFESYADETTYPYLGLNKYHVQLSDFSGETFADPNYAINGTKLHKLQMCTDTLSMADALAGLGSKPPITLTQKYYQCRPKVSQAVILAIGNAAGSASLAVQIGTLVIGSLVVFCTNMYMKLMGRPNEQLMKQVVKKEVMAQYDQLKTDALCEMFKAQVEANRAFKTVLNKIVASSLDQHSSLQKRLDAVEKASVARVADGIGLNYIADGGQRIGAGALNVFQTVEGVVEQEIHREIHQIEAALNLADPADPTPASPDDLMKEETQAGRGIEVSEDDKKKEQLEMLQRLPDDIDYFESVVASKFDRIKLLYNMRDVILAAEEQREARMKAGLSSGDEDEPTLESDLAALSAAYPQPPAPDPSFMGQVGYGLSYLNPFSYVPVDLGLAQKPKASAPAIELTPAQRAALQIQGLPKVDKRYLIDQSTQKQQYRHDAPRGDYRDSAYTVALPKSAPVVDSEFCGGGKAAKELSGPYHNRLGGDIDPTHLDAGWESDSDGDSDVGRWQA